MHGPVSFRALLPRRALALVGVLLALSAALVPTGVANAASGASLQFEWDSASPYLGELVVSSGDAGTVATVSLAGAVFVDDGGVTRADVQDGTRLAIAVDQGDGVSPTVDVEATATFGSSATSSGSTTISQTATVTRPATFAPIISSVSAHAVLTGEPLQGAVTVASAAPWPRRANGLPARITLRGVLYGPFATGSSPASPSSASPVAAQTSIVTTTGSGSYPFTVPTVAAGEYVWVWSISRSGQAAGACGCVLPAGYHSVAVPVVFTVETPVPVPVSADPESDAVTPAGSTATGPVEITPTISAGLPETGPRLIPESTALALILVALGFLALSGRGRVSRGTRRNARQGGPESLTRA
ncbi:hypothetical protein ACFSBZ_05580 [Amnibacterium flavum]|uniref:Uncharacterized protein n=1 Tax=Amnibacterium flavum TaxID=2173173 RepID=A0A2V1HND2_9MICO|nr:hypothetical protein [Amnibacterium flavum]PVZ94058.1 hypothetical protein DDQ50_09900 [Amnibacterium flavum]